MKKTRFLIGFVVLMAVVGGCTHMAEYMGSDPGAPKKKLTLDEEYVRKGKKYEVKGDLVAAYKQYTLAISVNPSNREAVNNRKLVEKELRSLADKHYKKGLDYQNQGRIGHARRQFLIALRLWPDYPQAVRMLTSRKRPKPKKEKYIVHTIKPGETLSMVAKTYYGDYRKFTVIAKYNKISDNSKIEVGQKIKVPEIRGTTLLAGKKKIKTKSRKIPSPLVWYDLPMETTETEDPSKAKVKEKVEEKNEEPDQVAIYRDHAIELFNESKYHEASIEFNKVLNVSPEDSTALKYAYESHFHQAMALYENEDYLRARDQFKASLRYRNDCRECRAYIKESENLYKEIHYKKGIEYFGKELLIEAIDEWELVQAVDPDYKRAAYLIGKANTILKKLEKLKASQAK